MGSFKFVVVIILILFSAVGRTENLLDIYHLAEMNDPTIQAAKQAQLVAREAIPQARAQFMPVINANACNSSNDNHYGIHRVGNVKILPNNLHYNQSTYGLSLTQPVFYYQQWVQLAKACEQVKEANATYAAAEQDLIVRSIQGYFGVLKALDALKYAKAARLAFENFLQLTEERFKVALIANTDVQIARAQRDNAYSQEIAAANEVENQKEQLRTITGQKIDVYAFLRETLTLRPPEPADIEAWVEQATEQNFTLLAARFQVEASRNDIKLNNADHLPTLSIGAGVTQSTCIPTAPRHVNRNLGLQVQLPIFSGGSVTSRTRQAVHSYEKTFQEMEALFRQTESNTRQAYLGVLTQINQINALKQAMISNRSALVATKDAFSVGNRTIVDVLTSQSSLIQAELNYANTRYDYILQSVQLKQAAGTLNPDDVRHINAWLKN